MLNNIYGGVMNWEIGIDIYTLICIKWITNKNLLYKKINKIQFKKNPNIYYQNIELPDENTEVKVKEIFIGLVFCLM